MSETRELVHRLLAEMAESIDRLQGLSDEDLNRTCDHGCAMDGGIRRLLVHNAEHDRMHVGLVSNARYGANAMQESELARLLRDWLRERTELVEQLLVSDDSVLELQASGDEWTVREHMEHVLHWERDTIDTVVPSEAAS
jgi:hypothetical protein